MMSGMDYSEGIDFMRNLYRNNQTGKFEAYQNIIVNYPGRKKAGDYRLEIVNEKVPTHGEICQLLHNLIKRGHCTYERIYALLERTYNQGTKELDTDEYMNYLQHLIYWVTLQEEINYPRRAGYAGINLPFCRFFEAIYCTRNEDFTIDTVIRRCNNHGKSRPELYKISNAPGYYHETRQ